MALRVTQQYFEFLADTTANSEIRATAQYVEVVGAWDGTIDLDGEDTVTVTDTVAINFEVSASASSTLNLTQLAEQGTVEVSAASFIPLSQEADSHIYNRAASSALVITDEAELAGFEITFQASSPLALVQDNEVQAPIYTLSVHVIPVTDEARVPVVTDATIIDVPGVTDSAERTGTQRLETQDTLSLEDNADTDVKSRSVFQTIVASDETDFEFVKTVSQTLSITDAAVQGIIGLTVTDVIPIQDRVSSPYDRSVTDTLDLTDETDSNIKGVQVEDTIFLAHNIVENKPFRVSAENKLNETIITFVPGVGFVTTVHALSDEAKVNLDVTLTAASQILWSHQVGQVVIKGSAVAGDAEDTLTVTDEARLSIPAFAEDTLSLTQSVTEHLNTSDAVDTIDIADEAIRVREGIETTSSELLLQHSVQFVVTRPAVECDYDIFIGESTHVDIPETPRTELPDSFTPPLTGRFQLVFPPYPSTPVESVLLRAPDYGNIERLQETRILRESRGGDLFVFADPQWPKIQSLSYQIRSLTYDKGQELLEFVESTIGKEIGILDHESRIWRVVITNPGDAVTHDSRGCGYTVAIEAEGIRLNFGDAEVDVESDLFVTHEALSV